MDFSDYIVYVDESGDHGLVNIDTQYPIFVLAFCIFKKSDYLKTVQDFQEFKFNHFGHDIVILHENEIRKDKGVFKILNNPEKKSGFIRELSDVVSQQEFSVISTTVKKDILKNSYRYDNNPYHIALKFCVEHLFNFLIASNQQKKIMHIVVEQRGKTEDRDLELEFSRICSNGNFKGMKANFKMVMANKQSNSTGLQLADLIARPIGLNCLRPEQENKSFEVIKEKWLTIRFFQITKSHCESTMA
ncbi:hypothetical protein BSPWISOXPB_8898 [uncultured Gammaproteobacteria bacterium]|nr:hypothetical protein BSPWISOXPB_8898 [uncultured Gammaproteobacteria bacterium]